MTKIKTKLVIGVAVLLLAGCATLPKSGPSGYQERVFGGTFKETYDAIIKSFGDAEYRYTLQNPDTGEIETDWKPETNLLAGLFIGRLRTQLQATLTRVDETHTRVEVEIRVEKQTSETSWEPTALVKEKDYNQLFNGIQENLKTIQIRTR